MVAQRCEGKGDEAIGEEGQIRGHAGVRHLEQTPPREVRQALGDQVFGSMGEELLAEFCDMDAVESYQLDVGGVSGASIVEVTIRCAKSMSAVSSWPMSPICCSSDG